MNAASGQWTLGVLIGLPFTILALLTVVIIGGISTWYWAREEGWLGGLIASVLSGLAFLAVSGLALFLFWPLNAEYHQYRQVNGTVSTIANRLISAGDKGGTNQKFVITLTGGNQQYGVDDTRAALLKVGDQVRLRCVRVYEYGSNNAGYDCKWGQ